MTIENEISLAGNKIFIFGSQANQEQLINADIDVGIESNEMINQEIISKIKYSLNESSESLFKFDVIDFSKVTDEFKHVAMKNIEVI